MHPDEALTPMLRRVLPKLAPDEAEWLLALALQPYEARARRLAERDAAVRAALEHFAHLRMTKASEALATALARYAASSWQHDRRHEALASDHGDQRAALHRVLRLNAGKPLRWRRIVDIASGTRG